MGGRHSSRRGRHLRRALGGVIAVLPILAGPGVGAETPQAHGYWWRLHTDAANISPPPIVPDNGLWVSNDGTGQHAVSAVRYAAPTGSEIDSLVLSVAEETGSTPVLLACPARGTWRAAEGGTWSERPASACDVAFARGDRRGETLVFDVRGLARNGVLDVVILAPADVGTAFSISFSRPGADSVVTRARGSSPPPGSSPPSSQRSTPRSTGGGSALVPPSATPTPTVTPSPSPDQEGASSALGDAVRDLAEKNRPDGGNGFLWLLAGVAAAIGVAGWRVRAGRARPEPPPASS